MWRCKQCGECCRGSPRLSKEDMKRLLKVGYKLSQFVEVINGQEYMKMVNERCVFLSHDGKKYYCRVYAHRPRICQIYPGGEVEDCRPAKLAFDDYLARRKK